MPSATPAAILALLTSLVAPQASPPPAVPAALLEQAMLAEHNAARAAVRQPPLTWDAALAEEAAAYAARMVRTGRMEHDAPSATALRGENIWIGTRGAYTVIEMAAEWTAERDRFRNAPAMTPAATASPHYSQMIWSRTLRLGCGTARGREDDVLVCRYLPAGNIGDQRALP